MVEVQLDNYFKTVKNLQLKSIITFSNNCAVLQIDTTTTTRVCLIKIIKFIIFVQLI